MPDDAYSRQQLRQQFLKRVQESPDSQLFIVSSGTAPPSRRIIKLSAANTIALAGDADENWIGAVAEYVDDPDFGESWHVLFRSTARPVPIEVAAADVLDVGNTAYLADAGKCASTGTIRLGSVMAGAAAGAAAWIVFD